MKNNNHQLKIKKFIIDAKNGFSTIFLSEESREYSNSLGRLFIMADAPKSAKKDISMIISKANEEYRNYQQEELNTAFERIFEKINPAIKKLAQKDNNINILIAAFAGNKISLSKCGKIYICLCDKNEITTISAKNKKTPGPKKATSQKELSEIVEVELNSEINKVLFFNDGFGDNCDENKLQSFVSDGSDNALMELKKYFQNFINSDNISNSIAFASIEIKKPELEMKEVKTEKIATSESIKILSALSDRSKDLALKISKSFSATSTNLKKMPRFHLNNGKNKYLAIIIILSSIFPGIQVFRDTSAGNQFNKISKIINDKKSEASALISSNKGFEAVNKLLEAKNIYSSAAVKSTINEKWQEKWGILASSIEDDLNKAGRVEKIDNPEKIAELSNFGIKFVPETIFKSENQIMITGSAFGLAYRIDLETKQRGFNFFSTMDDKIIGIAKSSNLILFFGANKKGYYYFPATKKVSDFNFEKQEWQTAALSEKFIDIFDEKENQIKRFTRSNLAAVEKINIKNNTKSIANDSQNIFIISESNEVIKIAGQQSEKIADLKTLPLLQNPDFITTNQSLKNYYTVNKKQRQIAAFTKDGQFIKQYNIENTGEIIDLFIENDKEIFILATDGVYKITLNL